MLLGATLALLCGYVATLDRSVLPDQSAYKRVPIRVHHKPQFTKHNIAPSLNLFPNDRLHMNLPKEDTAADDTPPRKLEAKTLSADDINNQTVLEKCASLLEQGIVCMFARPDPSLAPKNYTAVSHQHSHHTKYVHTDQNMPQHDNGLADLNMISPSGGIAHAQEVEASVSNSTYTLNNVNTEIDDTVAQAAMRAAVEVVRNRYTDALYQAQLNDGDVSLNPNDALALTQNAINSAADRAFESFMRENFGKRNFEGQDYDGLRGYFKTAFRHAATSSVKSIGKRFVNDLTSGGDFKSLKIRSELLEDIDENIARALIDTGVAAAKNSKYAFLRNLEFSYRIRENSKPEYSLLTVQPIYSSAARKHNLFAQAALSYEDSRQSISTGLGYRYMPESENYVVGSNLFLDYQRPYHHVRASAGLDVQTSLWGASANYYKGLSDWKSSRSGFQEKALDGFELELAGRMPFLPALEVFGRGYRWQGLEDAEDIDGTELRVEYSPIPAFTVEGLISDEDDRDTEFGMGIRYNYVFGAPSDYLYDWDEQFRQRSASEYIFRKVHRENIIRVQERADPDAPVPGSSAGVTTFSPSNGSTGISVGTDVTLTFTQDVQAGTGDLVFTDLTDGSDDFTIPVGDARVSFASNVVTIDLSAQLLEFSSDYGVSFASGVFEDLTNLSVGALNSGAYSFQTVANPIAGFPAPTSSFAANTTSSSIEPATALGTWQTTINTATTPDGVIFESGATGQGIAASFGGGNLVFAAGDGAATSTGTDSIFGLVSIASIPAGLHHFVFVADPIGPAEIGVYIDGIRVVNQSIAGAMQSGEWAGTDSSGYGQVGGSIRAGVNSAALSNATLTTNLSFYSGTAPAGF